MTAVLRIKLADLLAVITLPVSIPGLLSRPKPASAPAAKQQQEWVEADLDEIRAFLMGGPAGRRDLELGLNMSRQVVRHRLQMLKDRGMVEHLPGNMYDLAANVDEERS
ncbi:MAG: hypothetical protein HPY61_09260 [Methanotrichaceae archaeon]|nr:hypothetical protein [Methanotrichaceae archaeon]